MNDFAQQAQPEMIRLWTRLYDVVQRAYAQIQGESAHLYAYLCNEERARWTQSWQRAPASAIDPLLVADRRTAAHADVVHRVSAAGQPPARSTATAAHQPNTRRSGALLPRLGA